MVVNGTKGLLLLFRWLHPSTAAYLTGPSACVADAVNATTMLGAKKQHWGKHRIWFDPAKLNSLRNLPFYRHEMHCELW